jgi:hypothetical protein
MSNTAQGPGWWFASDGKWYPPELWTGPPSSRPPGVQPVTPTQPATQAQPVPTSWPQQSAQNPYGSPPQNPASPTQYPAHPPQYPGYTPASGQYLPQYQTQYPGQYGAPGAYPYGQPIRQKTNGMAIAALVCSCVGVFFLTAIAGIVFGFVAQTQIKRANGAQKGKGLALAGVIVGFAWLALLVVSVIFNHSTNDSNGGIVWAGFLLGS